MRLNTLGTSARICGWPLLIFGYANSAGRLAFPVADRPSAARLGLSWAAVRPARAWVGPAPVADSWAVRPARSSVGQAYSAAHSASFPSVGRSACSGMTFASQSLSGLARPWAGRPARLARSWAVRLLNLASSWAVVRPVHLEAAYL